MKLKLDKIIIDQGTQIRTSIDQKTVTEYAEAVMHKVAFPPLTVFHDGLKYYLADGFHRYFAYKNTLTPEVEVEVHNGTLRNAIEYALGANSKHGLKRSNDDKRNAVMVALNDIEWGMLTLREIAELCGVSHTFVSTIKEKIDEKPKEKKPKEVVDTPKDRSPKHEEIDQEFTEDDEIDALLVAQKELEDENTDLKDKLALKSMDATPEEKSLAKETIEELREENARLQRELDSMTISRNSYMKENAEMKKQLAWYKKQIQKAEKVSE
jgi:hypothetical protein